MKVLETQRLLLRRLREDAAAFIFELVNDPSWLRFIYARRVLGLARIVAIASPDNVRSARLLAKLGLRLERSMRMASDGHEVNLFATQ